MQVSTIQCDCEVQPTYSDALWNQLLNYPIVWSPAGCYYFADIIKPCTLPPKNITEDPINKYLIGTNVTLTGYYRKINGMTGVKISD